MEIPEFDDRTAQWMSWFGILNRTRPPTMGGTPPINPVTILDLSDRLQWPCDPDEAITVILAMDDAWRELHSKEKG